MITNKERLNVSYLGFDWIENTKDAILKFLEDNIEKQWATPEHLAYPRIFN